MYRLVLGIVEQLLVQASIAAGRVVEALQTAATAIIIAIVHHHVHHHHVHHVGVRWAVRCWRPRLDGMLRRMLILLLFAARYIVECGRDRLAGRTRGHVQQMLRGG